MTSSSINHLLRQEPEPFMIPTGSVVGIWRVENGEELERTFKLKHVSDVGKLLSDLDSDDCWLMYYKASGKAAQVIAVSEAMKAALCR